MKKMLAATIVGILLLSMTSVVYADETYEEEPDLLDSDQISEYEYQDEDPVENDPSNLQNQRRLKYQRMLDQKEEEKLQKYGGMGSNVKPRPRARFKGVWGYIDDEEIQGYFAGVVGRRGRTGFLKGVWNTTDGEIKGRVSGILKHGFFNGKVINEDGEQARITGFYRVNRENQTFHIKWMTPNKVGFAHAKYNPVRLDTTETIDDDV